MSTLQTDPLEEFTPENTRDSLFRPHQPRRPRPRPHPRSRPRTRAPTRNHSKKIEKIKVQGKQVVTPNHLVRFLIFDDRKKAMVTIRKDAVYYTLTTELKQKVSKSTNLSKLLEMLADAYEYPALKHSIQRRMRTIQERCRKHILKRAQKLIGPGIPVTKCINEDCPFSLESLNEIPLKHLITWRESYLDENSKIYGCDIRLLLISLRKDIRGDHQQILADEYTKPETLLNGVDNPFTRTSLNVDVVRRCNEYAKNNNLRVLYSGDASRSSRSLSPLQPQHMPFTRLGRIGGGRGIGSRRITHLNEVPFSGTNSTYRVQNTPLVNVHFPLGTIENVHSTHTYDMISERLNILVPITDSVSHALCELGFYTPSTVLSAPLNHMIRLLSSTLPGDVTYEQLSELIRFTSQQLTPLVNALSTGIHTVPPVRSALNPLVNHQNRVYSQSLRRRIRRAITMFSRCDLMRMTEHILEDIIHHDDYTSMYGTYAMRIADLMYRVYGSLVLIMYPVLCDCPEMTPEDDRKTFAIMFIGSLVEGRFLGEEFSWARFIE